MTMENIFTCKILLVDDEVELLTMLSDILHREGFRQVITAANCVEARNAFVNKHPDCVVLDVMLPDGDGFELMRELRSKSDIPVLFLSARDEDENRLLGLGLGADDYITKPFLPRELILRLKAVLSRAYFPVVSSIKMERIFYLGEAEINLNSGVVRNKDGRELTLTAKEFSLLEKLYENKGKIITSDGLCRAAWGDNLFRYENALMVHIRRLREKIEPDPSSPKYLVTVRGLGYKLTGVSQRK